MSYCVNCGVELADSEKKCPLCGVPVINPLKPYTEPELKPYPDRIEEVMKTIDLRFGVWLATLVLLIPCAVTLICNLSVNHTVSWSLYVIGACACIFVSVLLPLLLKSLKPYYFVLFNGIATSLYLLLICYLSGGSWFLPLALPITAFACLISLLGVFVIRRKLPLLNKIALILLGIGVFCVLIECTLIFYLRLEPILVWSVYVVIVLCIFSVGLSVLQKRQDWKEQIRRKLLM